MDRIGHLKASNTLSEQALRLRYKADPAPAEKGQPQGKGPRERLDVSTSSHGEVRNQRRMAANATPPALTEADRQQTKAADERGREVGQQAERQKTQLRYRRDDRTLLKIRTQEGDVIKLRFAVSDAIRVQAKENADEQALAELQMRSRQDQRLSIRVKGELNEQEMAAVRSVIEQAGSVADDFFANDLAGAFATASSFSVDGSQLARVNLDLRRRESLTYSELGSGPQEAKRRDPEAQRYRASDGPTPDAKTPAAAEGDAVRTPDAPITQPANAVDGPLPAEAAVEQSGPKAIGEGETATGSLADALSTINRFLQRLLDRFEGGADAKPDGVAGTSEFGFTFKLQVFESMVFTAGQGEGEKVGEQSRADAEEPKLPDLLSDTLAGLASESSLTLSARA